MYGIVFMENLNESKSSESRLRSAGFRKLYSKLYNMYSFYGNLSESKSSESPLRSADVEEERIE